MIKRYVAPLAGAAVVAAGLAVAGAPGAHALIPSDTAVRSGTVKAAAPAPVRSVRLFIDKSGVVGETVTGFITVSDTSGLLVSPVADVQVTLQEKKGSSWTDLTDGVTDANGRFTVSTTLDTNTTFRPVYKTAAGRLVAGPAVALSATARVTWATRPDLDLPRGTSYTYGFRISPATVPSGHFEIANAKTPTKWVKNKSVQRSNYGLVTQRITFPKAGTWLIRGASDPTKANGTGYTSTLKITVR